MSRVCLVNFFFKPLKYYEIKVLESMIINDNLDNILSTNVTDIMVKSNCLEVVHLLNDKSLDSFEVSFFIEEIKSLTLVLRSVSYFHVKSRHNFLTHSIGKRAVEENASAFLLSLYLEWFVSLLSLDIVL